MNSGIGDDTDYPKKDEFESKEEYNNAVKKHFKLKGLNHRDDFSENEKKTIVEDCTIRLMGTKLLSQKYNTLPCVISYLVHRAKSSVTPNDLSKFPDFPKQSEGMSDREYQKSVNKYFKYRKLREYRKKNPVILKALEYPNFRQKSDDMSDEDHQKFISILTQTIIPFMLTSIITIVSYGYLWYYIWQNRKFVKNNSNTMKSMLTQREYNTTVTLFLVCFCYFVFVLPIIIMQIIGDLGPDKSIDPRGTVTQN